MSEEIKERINFPQKIVDEVLAENGNCCMMCGSFLIKGYHKDHKDGDRTNVKKENLNICCPPCHRSKQGNTINLQKWRKVQEEAIKQYDELYQKALSPDSKLSGAHIDKLFDIIKEKVSEGYKNADLSDYPTPLPPEITKLYDSSQELEMLQEYRRGFEDGLKSIRINKKGE